MSADAWYQLAHIVQTVITGGLVLAALLTHANTDVIVMLIGLVQGGGIAAAVLRAKATAARPGDVIPQRPASGPEGNGGR